MSDERAAVIADSGPGPVRVVMEAHGSALRLFSRREQNEIIRDMMHDVGEYFIYAFLEKRFTDYAKKIGYSTGRGWQSIKDHLKARGVIAGSEPFVYTGVMRFTALHDAHPEARATASKAYVKIRVPLGHAIKTKQSEMFKGIASWEMTRLAEIAEKSLVQHLEGKLAERMTRPKAPAGMGTPQTRRQQREQSHQPKARDHRGRFLRGA